MKRISKQLISVIIALLLLFNHLATQIVFAETVPERQEISEFTLEKIDVVNTTQELVGVRLDASVVNQTGREKTYFVSSNVPILLDESSEKPAGIEYAATEKTIEFNVSSEVESHVKVNFDVVSSQIPETGTIEVSTEQQKLSASVPATDQINDEKEPDSVIESDNVKESNSDKEMESDQNSMEVGENGSLKQEISDELRDPLEINSLLTTGEKFIKDFQIKVYDSHKELDPEVDVIPADANIQIIYSWEVPQRMLDEHVLKSGDYYDIKLPDNLEIKLGDGPLIGEQGDYGTYEILPEGIVRLTFNQRIEEENDVSGTFYYSQKIKDDSEAGDIIIKVPIEDEIKEFVIPMKPKGGNSISKIGKKSSNQKEILWEISINTNMNNMVDGSVTEEMPDGLNITNISIYPQTVKLNGTVIISETALVEGLHYIIDGSVVKFIGDYANTNQSFQLVYQTEVDDDKIPFDGGRLDFHNTATLNDGTKDYSASATVSTNYGKLIEKSNPKVDTTNYGQLYNWTIKYNYGNKNLPAGSYVYDTILNEFLDIVQDSVKVKDQAGKELKEGDYLLEFGLDGKSVKVIFPDGISYPVDITYQTKFNTIIDDDTSKDLLTLKNSVVTNDGYKAESKGTAADQGIVKYINAIDYNSKEIKWSIEINRSKYQIFNWYMIDTMSTGLTFDRDSFVIKEKGSDRILQEGIDYEFVADNTNDHQFHVRFIGALASNGTDKVYVVNYDTYFDSRLDEGKTINQAVSYWEDGSGNEHQNTTENKPNIKPEFIVDASKGGAYNAQTKKITWTTIVNYYQDELKNATIQDPIIGDQTFVPGSAKLYEVTIPSNGSAVIGAETTDPYTIVEPIKDETNSISVKLPEGSKKSYALVFDTTLDGKVITSNKYENTATYENNDRKNVVKADITVANGGKHVDKTGVQEGSFINWTVTVNSAQSTLSQVEVTDIPSANQILDAESIKIYGTTISSDGNITKNSSEILQKGIDYDLILTTDNITGDQVAAIKFKNTITTAYVIEYSALINATSGKPEEAVTNTVSIKAFNEKVIKDEITDSKMVIVSGGTGTGSKASVTLVKIDGDTQIPLKGAKLELWSTVTKDGKLQKQKLVRSGETDEEGKLKFGNLRADQSYLLYEVEAPKGFTISEELLNGKELKLSADTEINTFQEIKIINEMAKITFKKVDKKNPEIKLKGASFAIINDVGKFYNGLSKENIVQWVDSVSDISESTLQSLMSDNEGIVTVKGLTEGNYFIKELKSPVRYVKTENKIPFTVVKEGNGVIRLSKSIPNIKNELEKTSIEGEKVWDDYNNKFETRPESINVNLMQNGEKIKSLEVRAEDHWKFEFNELVKYDENGEAYQYSFTEDPVKGYETSIEGTTITNTYRNTEKVEISGEKVWDDYNNKFDTRPENIIINLMQNGEKIESLEISADRDGKWKFEFNELAKYDEEGEAYQYSITEEPVKGYESSIEGTTITNTYRNTEKVNISGEKVWDDYNNKFETRPESIIVNLMQNEEKIESLEVSADKDGKWKFEFEKLAKYDEEGEAYQYSLTEDSVKGYETIIEGMTITNTYRNTEKTSIQGEKVWDDYNNKFETRPESIIVNLMQNGEKIESLEVSADKDGKWKFEFNDLSKYDEAGEAYQYSLTEDPVKDYEANIDGTTITNTYRNTEKIKISGEKVWDDYNNKFKTRPESIIVNLMQNGKKIKSLEVRAEDHWKFAFNDLVKYDEKGEAYQYSLTENPVKGYKASIDGTTITNTYQALDKPAKPNGTAPNTGDATPVTALVSLLVTSSFILCVLTYKRKKQK